MKVAALRKGWAIVGCQTYSNSQLASLLPFPKLDANKFTRGKLIVVAGSSRYPGAACLCSCAGEKLGAGYTEVFTDVSALDLVRASSSSLVVNSINNLNLCSLIETTAQKPCAYAVGSGFDAADGRALKRVQDILASAAAPVLVDGGGLAAVASDKGRQIIASRCNRGFATVLTPHGGEALRLVKPLSLQSDNPANLSRILAQAYGAVIMLKGPVTYISDGHTVVRMDEGSSALAKAGTGDVLAGMTGALLAQGLDAVDACVLASTLHARAACVAAKHLTPICVVAKDVICAIPEVIKALDKMRTS